MGGTIKSVYLLGHIFCLSLIPLLFFCMHKDRWDRVGKAESSEGRGEGVELGNRFGETEMGRSKKC